MFHREGAGSHRITITSDAGHSPTRAVSPGRPRRVSH